MVVSRVSRSFPASRLLAAGVLCLAVSSITQAWADASHIQADNAYLQADDSLPVHARTAFPEESRVKKENLRKVTPSELSFSTGWLVKTADEVQLNLRVSEVMEADISGLLQTVDEGSHSLLTLTENHGNGVIETRNEHGTYGRLHVRRLKVSLDEIIQVAGPGSESNAVFDDDIYHAYRQLLIALNVKKDYIGRDSLLQANSALIIRRADGNLDIHLYRRNASNGSLDNLGELSIDSRHIYELKGEVQKPEYQAQREAILQELQKLEAEIGTLSEQVMQMMESGKLTGVQEKMDYIEELKTRFRTLFKEIETPNEFEFFAVTETVNYEASHWLKFTDESGMAVAGPAVSYKVMSSLVEGRAAKLIAEADTEDLKRVIDGLLSETLKGHGRTLYGTEDMATGEGHLTYLTRRLATVWSVLQGHFSGASQGGTVGYEMQPVYVNDQNMATPVIRVRGASLYPTTGLTTERTLQEMRELLTTAGKISPDKFAVTEDQLQEMKAALGRSGWAAWLKSFYNPDAYQPSKMADDLRAMMSYKNVPFNSLVQSSGVQGGLPVHVIDKVSGQDFYGMTSDVQARELLNQDNPQVLVHEYSGTAEAIHIERKAEALTNDVRERIEHSRIEPEIERVRRIADQEIEAHKPDTSFSLKNQAWGTLMAAGTGMATGFVIQRGVDIASKYYNEGITPWEYTNKESERQQERALHTGTMMALSGAVNYTVLPYVAENSQYFTGVTGSTLMQEGLKGKFDASVAGGISGFAAKSLYSGYQYYQGNMTGTELALDVADAAGRTIPTVAMSALGHWALPYAFDVPYVSAFLPVGFVGAVAGSMAGNALYDTAKHYALEGANAVNNYMYGGTTVSVDTANAP